MNLKENNPDRAIERFKEAEEVEKKNLYSRDHLLRIDLGLAKAYMEKGDLDKAELLYNNCLEIINFEPNRFREHLFRILNDLGDIYKKRGFLNEAMAFYYEGLKEAHEDVHEETPIKANFFRKVANIYAEKGEEKEAERCLGQAMDLLSRDVFTDQIDDIIDCYYTWGKIHLDYGRNHLAAKFFRPIVELEMLIYGPIALERIAFRSLKEACDALSDKTHLEAVQEKMKKMEMKSEKMEMKSEKSKEEKSQKQEGQEKREGEKRAQEEQQKKDDVLGYKFDPDI